jgi:hypothetical protein
MLRMGLEIEDSNGFSGIIEQLRELGTHYSGVELRGARNDGVDMDDIIESLSDNGRDFFSADDATADAVAAAMAAEVERRASAAKAKGRVVSDDSLAAAGLKAAMGAYMAAVKERIENQVVAGGGAPKELTPAYAALKQRKYGFTTPIGKATGQLLAALVPGGGTAGKIQLIRQR